MNTKPRITLAHVLGILFLLTTSKVPSAIITFNPSEEWVHLGPSMAIDPDCSFFSNDVQSLVNITPPLPPDPDEADDED